MLSSVLHSPQAVRVNIQIMRAFVRLRNVLAMNAELAQRLDEIEKRLGSHDKQFSDHEQLFVNVIREIKHLMSSPSAPKKRRIGFHVESDEETPPAPASRLRNRKKP